MTSTDNREGSFGTIRHLLMLAIHTGVLALAGSARAAVYWDDGFEPPQDLTGWDTNSSDSSISLTTEQAAEGAQSVKLRHTSLSVGEGPMIWRSITPSQDFYARFYLRTSPGFTYSTSNTKILLMRGNAYYPGWEFGSNDGALQLWVDASFDRSDNDVHLTSTPIPSDRWICVQSHIKYNTPGQADGSLEVWIDGQLKAQSDNREFVGPTPTSVDVNGNPVPSYATTDFIELYNERGVGDMYYDGIGFGDEPVPCLGSTSDGATGSSNGGSGGSATAENAEGETGGKDNGVGGGVKGADAGGGELAESGDEGGGGCRVSWGERTAPAGWLLSALAVALVRRRRR